MRWQAAGCGPAVSP